jgi:hypothetical protein
MKPKLPETAHYKVGQVVDKKWLVYCSNKSGPVILKEFKGTDTEDTLHFIDGVWMSGRVEAWSGEWHGGEYCGEIWVGDVFCPNGSLAS